MGNSKKRFDEKLQEIRTKHHDSLRYRKRVQEEHEANKQLKDYDPNNESDDDPIHAVP